MGFLQNIKNKLGIGGVSVALHVPAQIAKSAGIAEGKIVLTTKSDQEIVNFKVKMIEEFTTGRGDEKKTKEFTLGEITIPGGFTIKTGETREITFSLPFKTLNSSNDDLKEKGGVMGTIGKLGAMAGNEKSEYFIQATADVKSAALDPDDKKDIRLV
jgi:hypothetical protein